MKVELNSKDIEYILMLLKENAENEYTLDGSQTLSMEDLLLIDRLESALRRSDVMDEDLFENTVSTLQH